MNRKQFSQNAQMTLATVLVGFCLLWLNAQSSIARPVRLAAGADSTATTTPFNTVPVAVPQERPRLPQSTGGPNDTTGSQKGKYWQAPKDDSLRILVETRLELGHPEPYVTLLVITEGGNMEFSLQRKSQPEKKIWAKLRPSEWKVLKKSLNLKTFSKFTPESQTIIAVFKQAVSVQKGEQRQTIRYSLDPIETDMEEQEKEIKAQLGAKIEPHWQFMRLVRALNARFKVQ